MTRSSGFLRELKRRKVFGVAVVYAASAFVVLQAADIMLPRLGVPEWGMSLVVVLSIVGFVVALVLGWALELTPKGIRTTPPSSAISGTAGIGTAGGASRGTEDPEDARGVGDAELPSLFGRRTLVTAALLVVLGVGIGVGMGGGMLFRPMAGDAGVNRPVNGAAPSEPDGLAVPADDRSIAVLAFANMSEDPSGEYFADGLSEEILNVLSQVLDLRVAGRTSSFAWKGRDEDLRLIGSTLGVAHILEGSVRRQDDRVRVTAQLIRASDGFHLWSETYDRTLKDVFVVQDDIAGSVLRALRIVLNEEERARMERIGIRNVDAFVAYQRGVELYDLAHGTLALLPTLLEANALFQEATRIVPEFSAAHFRMADYYSHVLIEAPDGHDRGAAVGRLRELLAVAAETATDPNFRAHREVDRVLFSSDWRTLPDRVERALSQEGCPFPTYIEPLAIVGFAEPMTRMSEAYVRCDPLSFSPWYLLMRSILQAEAPERALVRIDDGIRALGPSPWASHMRMLALLAAERFEEGAEEGGRIPPGTEYVGPGRITLPLAAAGRLEEARSALAEDVAIYGAGSPFLMASHAAVGDRAAANRIAATLDTRPDGAWVVLAFAQACFCGAPFDLDATPNLRARLEEAGLPWPPRTVIHFPAKDG